MKFPHCATGIKASWSSAGDLAIERHAGQPERRWRATTMTCPECGQFIGRFQRYRHHSDIPDIDVLGWPQTVVRPVPSEVDERYAQDFTEAVSVLPASAKASAAL